MTLSPLRTSPKQEANDFIESVSRQAAGAVDRIAHLEAEIASLRGFLANPFGGHEKHVTALSEAFESLLPDVDKTIKKDDPELAIEISLLTSKMNNFDAQVYATHPRHAVPFWQGLGEKPSKKRLQAYWMLISPHWIPRERVKIAPHLCNFYEKWCEATNSMPAYKKLEAAHQDLEEFRAAIRKKVNFQPAQSEAA
jgi:hypothetical protein